MTKSAKTARLHATPTALAEPMTAARLRCKQTVTLNVEECAALVEFMEARERRLAALEAAASAEVGAVAVLEMGENLFADDDPAIAEVFARAAAKLRAALDGREGASAE